MSSVYVDLLCRPRMQPQAFTRNGQLVDAGFHGNIASLLNQVSFRRTKECFRGGGDVISPVQSKAWRWAGHIGPLARTIIARVVMAPSNQVTSTHNPKMQLTLTDTSGNTIGTGNCYYGTSYGKTADEIPSEWSCATIAIDVRSYQDTAYRAQLSAAESARAISCTVHEVAQPPSTENNYLSQSFSANQPILDTDRSSIVSLAHRIYKRGLGRCFTWSSSTDATAPTNISATYADVLSVSLGDRRGPYVPLSYCSRKTKSTVPVRFDVYAGMASGTGQLRVVDAAGNIYASYSVSGSPAWGSITSANLPADGRQYCIQHAGNGAAAITTYAVSCYRYTT